ncbi:MAG TPA: deoxyguanosinetriphosphate triphosphohydrolase [Actinomycetes bacterium]|nr:deoxyguanosinetriphosphate triphosphohydrolase [Actinomycetes bacterium]
MSGPTTGPMSGYDEAARQRWAAEPVKRTERGPFARDRARVLHSAGLRRLAAKTQVYVPGYDDFVRNRLTHSLEVAQVGRELGKSLGCDPDVVDTACLAHDLGHPPFGHTGEQGLDAAADGIGGFEGNAQTLRLLTRLEAKTGWPDGRSAGLNLTRASLDAATKYPWPRGARPGQRDPGGKFGVYEADAEVFEWLRRGAPDARPCLEAQVMDWADDVAYSVHDVEDGIQGGAIDLDGLADREVRAAICAVTRQWYLPERTDAELVAALDRLVAQPYWPKGYDGSRRALAGLKNLTSELVGRFCTAAQLATQAAFGPGPLARYGAELLVPPEHVMEVSVLKGIAAHLVMLSDDRVAVYQRQRDVIRELVEALSRRAPDGLEPAFRNDWRGADDDTARLRVVIDQVASLTDASALAWHQRLIG